MTGLTARTGRAPRVTVLAGEHDTRRHHRDNPGMKGKSPS
jgi:hypothetical protein